jgi:hypothetical protein
MTGRETMKLLSGVSVIAGIAALVAAAGCGKTQHASEAPPVNTAAAVPLPDWSPVDPSPEFVRAARVLKPLPLDYMKSPGRTDAENAVRMKGAAIMWPAAYEFFGTLSDSQVERFLQSKPKELVIPIKQLTPEQRAAVDGYFEAYRQAKKGQQTFPEHPELSDCLLMLYKRGAKRDLSNVAAGFSTTESGHFVHILFRVTQPDGETAGFGNAFAQI